MKTHKKPVVFVAFANDHQTQGRYLRGLAKEARAIREGLEPAADLIELVERKDATLDDILKVFSDPDYNERIVLFHFAGHASGFELMFESENREASHIHASSFAEMLSQLRELKLVFLNGCSTANQTDKLLSLGIPLVISTATEIDDDVATELSRNIYRSLGKGASVDTAFSLSVNSAKAKADGAPRKLYFGKNKESQPRQDRWPWELHVSPGAEKERSWSLATASSSPLFGLPKIPDMELPQSPFLNLARFEYCHAPVFFGRGSEIRDVFRKVTSPAVPPLILLFGKSGVGKSSILEAGVQPRLAAAGYDISTQRRDRNIGLTETLLRCFEPEGIGLSLNEAWHAREGSLGKRTIAIVDQVEEVFTQPNGDLPGELTEFLVAIRDAFKDRAQRPQGKVILSFRSEWLAEIEDVCLELRIPHTKVCLERLSHSGVAEAVSSASQDSALVQRYGLSIDPELSSMIADDLLEDPETPVAPTLQVLLTKMWNIAEAQQPGRPHFSVQLYQDLKRRGILLDDFLDEQIELIRSRHPADVDSGLLLDLLARHTTDLGTAKQQSVPELNRIYAHCQSRIDDVLQSCEDQYLLSSIRTRNEEKRTRLTHDTLAKHVRVRYEKSDLPGQRARRILDNRSVDWVDGKQGEPLDANDLRVVEHGANGTRSANETESRLIDFSRKHQARAKYWRSFFRTLGYVAIGLIVLSAAVSFFFWLDAKAAKELAEGNAKEVSEQKKIVVEEKKSVVRQLAIADRERAFNLRDNNHDWIKAAHLLQKSAQGFEDSPDKSASFFAVRSLVKTLRLINVVDTLSTVKGVHFLDTETMVIWGNREDAGFLETRKVDQAEPIARVDKPQLIQVLYRKGTDQLICVFKDSPPQILAGASLESVGTVSIANAESFHRATLCNGDSELLLEGTAKQDKGLGLGKTGLWHWSFSEAPTADGPIDLAAKFQLPDGSVTSVYPGGKSLFYQTFLGAYLIVKEKVDWKAIEIHRANDYPRGFLIAPKIAVCFFRVDNGAMTIDLRSGKAERVDSGIKSGRSGKLNPDGRSFVISGDHGTSAYSVDDFVRHIDNQKNSEPRKRVSPSPIRTGEGGRIGTLSRGGRITVPYYVGRMQYTRESEKIRFLVSQASLGTIYDNTSAVKFDAGLEIIDSGFVSNASILMCLTGENRAAPRGQRAIGELQFIRVGGQDRAAFSIRHASAITGFEVNSSEDKICTWSDDGQVRVWDFRPDGWRKAVNDAKLYESRYSAYEMLPDTNLGLSITDSDSKSIDITKARSSGAKISFPTPDGVGKYSFKHWDPANETLLTISKDQSIRLNSPNSNDETLVEPQKLKLNFRSDFDKSFESLRSASLSLDGNRMLVQAVDRIIAYDISSQEYVGSIRAQSLALLARLSTDRKQIAIWGQRPTGPVGDRLAKGSLRVWDTSTLEPVTEVLYDAKGFGEAWLGDRQRYLYSLTNDLQLAVWNTDFSRRMTPKFSLFNRVNAVQHQGEIYFVHGQSGAQLGSMDKVFVLSVSSDPVSEDQLQYWTGTRLNDRESIEYLSEKQWRRIQERAK